MNVKKAGLVILSLGMFAVCGLYAQDQAPAQDQEQSPVQTSTSTPSVAPSAAPAPTAAPAPAAAAPQAQTHKITAISIEGEKNVKEKAIRNQVKSKVGKDYSETTVTGDIQNILGMGNFENVEVSLDTSTWHLTFMVREKPYIKKINFKGNKVFSQGKLKDEITLKEKEFYDLAKMEESKAKIISLYNDKGYADAKLEAIPTLDESNNQMTITFIITEGKRVLISDVKVEGVKSFKPKKVLKLMKTKKKKVFKEETLKDDINEIVKFYKNNGFEQVQVGQPQISYNDDRTQMFITIPITEGPKYKFGSISFNVIGTKVYNNEDLEKALAFKSGQVYNEDRMQESRAAIQELYSDKGYLHARVDPQFNPDPAKGLMNITFDVVENDQVFLGNVYIDGLVSTKEYVIRRELTLKEGDVFAASKVRRSMEKIYNLGFIDAVEPEIQPTEQPGIMDLVLNVTEGKPGMLTAGAGYSSVDQLVGSLQVQHINLFGKAQRLNLLWEFGGRRQNYEIDWTEPWLMNKPMSLGLGVFNTERVRDYVTQSGESFYDAYSVRRTGGSVRIGPRLNDNLSLQFGYSYEDIETFDVNDKVAADYKQLHQTNLASHDVTSSLTSTVAWDTRDNIFDASRGNRQSLSLQYAGGPLGGGINFIKPIVRSSWYYPTFWKFVLSLNGSVGFVQQLPGSNDVPIYERFVVGGADTVRGYKYNSEIGPSDGGKVMSVFNVEYKFPIVQEKKRTILQGAFFYDVGGAWQSPYDIKYKVGWAEDVNENRLYFKSGVGFGIRFTTPVFPLRLDWAYGLNHRPGEELQQFYFTIGNIF